MYNKIAIIGTSFQLPGMKNWVDFSASLNSKETYVKSLSSLRLKDIQNRFGPTEIALGGFLDRIDLFDNEYFNVTEREAVKMFPKHRFFLSYALKAFYDAGYNERHIKGSNTGIFFTNRKSLYINFLDGKYDFFDTLSGIEATRLANFLDIRGPVVAIDTTCSSSLVAMHNACLSLNQNECNMTLVGGVKLGTITKEIARNHIVMSNSESCKPFDNSADGMMNGEGAIFLVLKRLEDAKNDNDPIYAVIEGSAINHGGARISSLTAPSAEAQKDVILEAWENAGINPAEVRFIEAHGTGTILGDPIEFDGIQKAFESKGVLKSTCSISSIKAQVGHLDTLCGIAGLLRVIGAINNKILPPQVNFTKLNEHIESEDIVKVQREPEFWPAQNNNRIGGVSSFGLTGTNIHMVISGADVVYEPTKKEHYFLQLSAASIDALKATKEFLANLLESNEEINLNAFVQKINRLYKGDQYKKGISFSNKKELLQELKKSTEYTNTKEPKILLLNLDILSYKLEEVQEILEENLLINSIWKEEVGTEINIEKLFETNTGSVIFQYVFCKYLISLFKNKLQVFGKKGEENCIENLINNKTTPQDIIDKPDLIKQNLNEFNFSAFESFLSKTYNKEEVIIFNFSKNINKSLNSKYLVFDGNTIIKNRYHLYEKMLEVGQNPLSVKNESSLLNNLNLPLFNEKRFWPENGLIKTETVVKNEKPNGEDLNNLNELTLPDIKAIVKEIWKTILEIDQEINDEDDFFELGGDSLSGLDMLSDIERELKGSYISYEEMYSVSTLESLSQILFDKMNAESNNEVAEDTNGSALSPELRKDEYENLINTIRNTKTKPSKIVCKKVLVTGSTGFLGAYLVKVLLETSPYEIVCLVRGDDDRQATRRFWDSYFAKFNIAKNDRVKVVCGDLLRKDLALSKEAIQALKQIDGVYHAAGSPEFVSKIKVEKHINFLGTKNLFKWTSDLGVKYFNYISTIGIVGVSMPDNIDAFYETDLNLGQETKNFIHADSKLKAEEYLRNNAGDVKVNIYRISNVGGEFETGVFHSDLSKNLMYLKLQTLHKINSYSDELLNSQFNISLTPVDKLMKMICELSYFSNSIMTTFHLNFEKILLISEIIEAFRKNNVNFNYMEDAAFLEYIKKLEEEGEILGLKLNKHESYNKKISKNSYKIPSIATQEYLKKLQIEVSYNREEYLQKIIGKLIDVSILTS